MSGRAFAAWRAPFEPRPWVAAVGLVAFIALLPAEPLFNVAVIALAVLGLAALLREPRRAWDEARVLATLFACIWLPMVVSLPDAAAPGESARKAASFLLFPLAGLYVSWALGTRAMLDRVALAITVLLVAWSVDALWQFATGSSLLGFPYERGRVTGVFHPKLTIGIVLAAFFPLVLDQCARRERWRWGGPLWLVPVVLTIAVSGSRASWVALAVGAGGYALLAWRSGRLDGRVLRRLAAGLAVAVLLSAALAALFPDARDRAGELVGRRAATFAELLSTDRERIDRALARRWSIWETASNVLGEHWFNGVGPRGLRAVYAEHAGPADFFMTRDPALPPTHAHQILLEIGAETGVVGLAGYVLFVLAFASAWSRLDDRARIFCGPYALLVVVALFPLNAHKGFYGNFAAALVWWAVILAVASFSITRRAQFRPRSSPSTAATVTHSSPNGR